MPENPKKVRILAISGSLRSASSNTEILRTCARLEIPNLRFEIFSGLSSLPHFNPDDDAEPLPVAVQNWRAQLQDADALVFSSPEYAHGLPGVLKNALDWAVSSVALTDKPVAVIAPKGRGAYASASLQETLKVMGAKVILEACAELPLGTNLINADSLLSNRELTDTLRQVFHALICAVPQ